jgi:hypothetical protein
MIVSMTEQSYLTSTLEQLDGERWPDPQDPTMLVRDVHRLRRIPLGELSDNDLRLLLGQRVGVDWLVPRALDRLQEAPLAGDLYPGDLLGAVLHATRDYWPRHPDQLIRLWAVRESLEALQADAGRLLTDERWPAFG